MQSNLLPGHKLPNSYEAALHVIEPYLVQSIVYDVCKKDCVVFRNEFANLAQCPKCNSERYLSANSTKAHRTYIYLPLKPRLTRMFGTANIAAVLQSHVIIQGKGSAGVYDIQRSSAWEAAYNDGIFGGD